MNEANEKIFGISNADVAAWVDPGAAVHLKCVTPLGDPVELNAEEVKELCALLQRLLREIE